MSSRVNLISRLILRRAHGVTLLEVIATLLIGAIAALMAATVLSSGVMHVQQLVEENEAFMRASNCMERIKASYDRRGSLTQLDAADASDSLNSQVCKGSKVKVQYVKIEAIPKAQDTSQSGKGLLRIEVVNSKNDAYLALRLVTVTDNGVELRYVVRE